VTDGYNISSPTTITINLTTPSTPEVIPPTTPVASWQGGGGSAESGALAGMGSTQIPVGTPAKSATASSDPTIPDDGGADVTLTFTPTIVSGCTVGCTDLSKCTICPDTVTLQATAMVPKGLGLSTTGTTTPLIASLVSPLFTTPLPDIWSSKEQGGIIEPGTSASTGFLPVTLINPPLSGNEVPPTFFGQIFGVGLLSCAFAGQSTACPTSLISFAGGTGVSSNVGGAAANVPVYCEESLVICGQTVPFGTLNGELQPAGSAPNSWSLSGGAMPVNIELTQITGNASGTFVVNVFSVTIGSCPSGGLVCNTSEYSEGFAGNLVLGPQDISNPNFSVTFPSTGYWAVQAIYSGDANNNLAGVATVYNVTN